MLAKYGSEVRSRVRHTLAWVLGAALVACVVSFMMIFADAPGAIAENSDGVGGAGAASSVSSASSAGAVSGVPRASGFIGLFGSSLGFVTLGSFVFSCLLTALVEELLFRGALLAIFAKILAWREVSNPWPKAILCSAAAFGALHVTPDLLAVLGDAGVVSPVPASSIAAPPVLLVLLVQSALKFIQALAFGVCMACLLVETRSLAFPVLAHFTFDLLYFAPVFIATGSFPEAYLTGSIGDVVVLLLSTLLLLPPSVRGMRALMRT